MRSEKVNDSDPNGKGGRDNDILIGGTGDDILMGGVTIETGGSDWGVTLSVGGNLYAKSRRWWDGAWPQWGGISLDHEAANQVSWRAAA